MIDGTYKIKVDVPFGRKEGVITLRTEGDVAFADVDAPIIGKKSIKGHVEGDTFTGKGADKFKLVGKVDYTIRGAVSGDNLHIDIQTNKGELALEGTRV